MNIQSKLNRHALSLITGAILAAGSFTAIAATQQLGGKVSIQFRDISTSFSEWLDFGEVKVGPSGGTVTLSNDASVSFAVTGDVIHVAGGTEGQITIQGEKDEVVTVTLDETFTLVAKSKSGAADLIVTTSGQGDTLTLLAENGNDNYYQIGGTLTIPSNQPADDYQGSYNATVNYQ